MAGSGLGPSVPALLMSRSGPPRASAARRRSPRWAGSVMSPATAVTTAPAGSPAMAARSAAPSLASTTSRYPSSARARASARPSPREAPVTTATGGRAVPWVRAGPVPLSACMSVMAATLGRAAGGGIGRAVRLSCDVGPRTGARSARLPAPVTSCHGQVPSRGWREFRWPGRRGLAFRGAGGIALDAAAPGDAPGQDEVLRQVSAAVLAVTRELSVGDVLEVIVRSVRSLAGARYAAIGVPDDRGSFAEFVVDGISERQRKAIGPLPRQHGMLAVMLREGQPLRLADIRADPRFEGWPSAHPELADILAMPIKDGDRVLGFIFAANKMAGGGGGFTERDEEVLALFAAHAAIALTNARLYERARQLSVLEERARLARDLHDAVSQKLFSIRVKARAASVLASRDPASGDTDRAAAEMESVAALAGDAQAELRAVIDGLAPPEITESGLAGSLRRYALLAGKAHGVRVRFAAGDLPALGADREAALYRIAQEALHNALRHSGAAEVGVSVCAAAKRVTLEVTDQGKGFVPELAAGGRGLPSLRERAAGAGASLVIRSAPGQGTTVRVVMPVDRGGHGGPR